MGESSADDPGVVGGCEGHRDDGGVNPVASVVDVKSDRRISSTDRTTTSGARAPFSAPASGGGGGGGGGDGAGRHGVGLESKYFEDDRIDDAELGGISRGSGGGAPSGGTRGGYGRIDDGVERSPGFARLPVDVGIPRGVHDDRGNGDFDNRGGGAVAVTTTGEGGAGEAEDREWRGGRTRPSLSTPQQQGFPRGGGFGVGVSGSPPTMEGGVFDSEARADSSGKGGGADHRAKFSSKSNSDSSREATAAAAVAAAVGVVEVEDYQEPNWRNMVPALFPPGWRDRDTAAAVGGGTAADVLQTGRYADRSPERPTEGDDNCAALGDRKKPPRSSSQVPGAAVVAACGRVGGLAEGSGDGDGGSGGHGDEGAMETGRREWVHGSSGGGLGTIERALYEEKEGVVEAGRSGAGEGPRGRGYIEEMEEEGHDDEWIGENGYLSGTGFISVEHIRDHHADDGDTAEAARPRRQVEADPNRVLAYGNVPQGIFPARKTAVVGRKTPSQRQAIDRGPTSTLRKTIVAQRGVAGSRRATGSAREVATSKQRRAPTRATPRSSSSTAKGLASTRVDAGYAWGGTAAGAEESRGGRSVGGVGTGGARGSVRRLRVHVPMPSEVQGSAVSLSGCQSFVIALVSAPRRYLERLGMTCIARAKMKRYSCMRMLYQRFGSNYWFFTCVFGYDLCHRW